MKKMKQKDKLILLAKRIGVILALIIVIMLLTIILQQTNQIELTQLSPQSHSQMMGYLIKTKENKIIAIDGGTPEDTDNWIEHVQNLGGKIDTWFITHPHRDHAGVFNEVIRKSSRN